MKYLFFILLCSFNSLAKETDYNKQLKACKNTPECKAKDKAWEAFLKTPEGKVWIQANEAHYIRVKNKDLKGTRIAFEILDKVEETIKIVPKYKAYEKARKACKNTPECKAKDKALEAMAEKWKKELEDCLKKNEKKLIGINCFGK